MNYVRSFGARMLGGGAGAAAAAAGGGGAAGGAGEPVVEVVYDSGEEEEKPPQPQATSTRTMMEPEADGTPGTTSPPRHHHQPAVTNHPSRHAGVATQLTNKPGKAAAANMPNANWERGQTTNKHEETVTLSDGLPPSTSSQQDGYVFQKQMKKVRDWPMKQVETEKRQLVALRDRLKGGTSEQFKSVEAQRRAVENANEQIRATMKCIEEKRDQEQKNKPQAVETGDGGIQNYMKNNRSQTFLNQKLTPAMQEAGKRDENKRRNAAASGQSKTAQKLVAQRQAPGGGNNNQKAGAGAPLMISTFNTPLHTHGSAQYTRARGALQSEEQGKQPFTAYNKPSGVKAKSTFDFSSQSDDDAFEEPPQDKKPPNKRRATAKDNEDTFNVGELDVTLGRGTRTTSTYPMARPQRNAAVVANARRSHQQQLELYRSDHRNSEYDMQRAMEESRKEAKKRNQQQRLHEESLHKNAAPEVVDLLDSDDGDDGRVSDAEFEEASKSVQESGRTRRGRANRRWASQRPVSEKLASLRAVYPLVPSSAPANDARGVGAAPAPAADVAPSAVAVIDADDDAAAEAKAAKAGAGAAAQVGGTAAAPPGDAAAAGATTPSHGGRVNVELSGADLAYLERGEFLNDTVIDWRVLRVKLEDLAEQPDVLRRCHFFNSFFYINALAARGLLVPKRRPDGSLAAGTVGVPPAFDAAWVLQNSSTAVQCRQGVDGRLAALMFSMKDCAETGLQRRKRGVFDVDEQLVCGEQCRLKLRPGDIVRLVVSDNHRLFGQLVKDSGACAAYNAVRECNGKCAVWLYAADLVMCGKPTSRGRIVLRDPDEKGGELGKM